MMREIQFLNLEAFDDLELGIENLPFQNQQSVFIDLDIDSDLDVIFMKTSKKVRIIN